MNIRKRVWHWKGKKRVAYRVDWRRDGIRRQKQFKTKCEAERFRDKLIRERDAEEYGELINPNITLKEFVEIYEAKKPWRTESYQERVLAALRVAPFYEERMAAITKTAVEQYRDARLKTAKPATVRQDLAALSDAFKWAVKLGYARKNPVKDIERPSLPVKQDDPQDYITPEDFEKLMAKAGQDAPLYQFAAWTGIRESELLNLEWTDVKDGYVVVRRGKGRKQRIVPLLPKALEALAKAPRRLKEARIFWWMRDRYTTLRRFKRRVEWAGLNPAYEFHTFRHTFGSWAAQSGVDLQVIAEAMGHSSTTVTKLYAHLSPEYKRKELLKMGTITVQGKRKSPKAKTS